MSKKENGYKNMAELKLTDELEKNIKELFNKSIEGSKKDVCDKAVEYSFKLSAACNIKPTKKMIEIITEACIFAFGDGLTKGIVAACNVLSNDEVLAAIEQQTEEKGAEDAEKGN
jgi:hypothetical protein